MSAYTVGLLAAFLRVVVGAAYILHGLPKIRGGWRQSGLWIKMMGVPPIAALLVAILEFFGGIFLIVGLVVPLIAVFFAIQMASIIVMKKFQMKASFIGGGQGKPTYEIDVTYLLLAIALVFLGAGPISLDNLLGF